MMTKDVDIIEAMTEEVDAKIAAKGVSRHE